MSEFALLSLRDVAPLGIPASLPVPPAPSGGDFTFDQRLAEASQRQEAEVAPREEAVPREPQGEYRRLELPNRNRPADPPHELRPTSEEATPRDPEAPIAAPEQPTAISVTPSEDPAVQADPAVLPDQPAIAPIRIAPPIISADAPTDVAIDPAVDAVAIPLMAPTEDPVDTWHQPTLSELFPDMFAGLPVETLPSATANPLIVDGTQLPVNAAGAPLGLNVPVAQQPDAPPVEIATLTPRERRYGFGLGKPFQGHAAVNRRNIDRFGREIPLPTSFVTRTIAANTVQTPLVAKTADIAPQVAPLMGPPMSDTALPMQPVANQIPISDKNAPQIPVTDDDTPTFGSQVAYKPQAVHLRATTPGFSDSRAFDHSGDHSADQRFNSDTKKQSAIAPPPVSDAYKGEIATPQDFGLSLSDRSGRNAIAPPVSMPEPLVKIPDGTPLKESTTGPINLNGITATLTRGSGESTGTGEPSVLRETAAFRNIAADLTAKLSKEAVPEGATRLRVTLRPRELGTITIELIRQGDQLETRITTRTKEAQALFEKLMPELKVQLEERGFNVRSLDLTHQQQLGRDEQGHASRDWTRPNHGWEKPPLPRPLLDIPEPENGELDLRDIADGLNLTV